MTASYSTRMHLIIPAGTDAADINTIISNWQKLDGTSGMLLCTEAAKPVTNLFPGLFIKCTDSGKHYYLDGSGGWVGSVYSGAAWIEDSYVTALALSGGQVFYGNTDTTAYSYVDNTAATSNAIAPVTLTTANANQKVRVDYDIQFSDAGVMRSWIVSTGSGTLPRMQVRLDGVAKTAVKTIFTDNPYSAAGADTPPLHRTISGSVFITIPTAAPHTIDLYVTGGSGAGAGLVLQVVNATAIVTLSS